MNKEISTINSARCSENIEQNMAMHSLEDGGTWSRPARRPHDKIDITHSLKMTGKTSFEIQSTHESNVATSQSITSSLHPISESMTTSYADETNTENQSSISILSTIPRSSPLIEGKSRNNITSASLPSDNKYLISQTPKSRNLNNNNAEIAVPKTVFKKGASMRKAASTQKDTKSPPSKVSDKHHSGRWTKEEHEAFLHGLQIYGREWKKVAQQIPTRNSAQIRSHAQKYFAKLARDEQQQVTAAMALRSTPTRISYSSDNSPSRIIAGADIAAGTIHLPPSALQRMNKILKDPDGVQREVEDTLSKLRARYEELQRRVEQRNEIGTQVENTAQHHLQINHDIDEYQCMLTNTPHHVDTTFRSDTVVIPPKGDSSHVSITTSLASNNNSEQSLVSNELIALTVLGKELHQSSTEENTNVVNSFLGNEQNESVLQKTISSSNSSNSTNEEV